MLDSVGLLSKGNDEMMRFAWKAFAQWQTRLDETQAQKDKKKETFEYLRAFRETFSRPVRRIRFLGLFDTVVRMTTRGSPFMNRQNQSDISSQNSVPRFETAWLKRARFPYTSKSSAKVIRHAVSIDERRAKFRQNLISQKKGDLPSHQNAQRQVQKAEKTNGHNEKESNRPPPRRSNTFESSRFKPRRNALYPGSKSVSRRPSTISGNSNSIAQPFQENETQGEEEDENAEQDVQEIWFPGCHADIGGGWPQEPGMEAGLSHAPMLWMIREARKAGLPFNEDALEDSGYLLDDVDEDQREFLAATNRIPEIRVEKSQQRSMDKNVAGYDLLHVASTKGVIHDSLLFRRGTPPVGVLGWRMMEYLPFRRMDLKSNGTWAPIRWPLPFGEVRDIPDDAWIHSTALKRMDADETYRPGNLIIGGGGRGIRIAPAHAGTGKWDVVREKGNPVGETFIRSPKGIEEIENS